MQLDNCLGCNWQLLVPVIEQGSCVGMNASCAASYVDFGSNLYPGDNIAGVLAGLLFLGDCKVDSCYWRFKESWEEDTMSWKRIDSAIIKVFKALES